MDAQQIKIVFAYSSQNETCGLGCMRVVVRERKRGEKDIPSRTRDPPGCLDGTAKEDELHTVNHGRAAGAADEGLDERFESVHCGGWGIR